MNYLELAKKLIRAIVRTHDIDTSELADEMEMTVSDVNDILIDVCND
jgi:transcription initiation factor IIE alpha subunit